MVVENLWESQTTKLLRALLQETMSLVEGSSTTSKVLVRNGGGPTSCNPSLGCGKRLDVEDEGEEAAAAANAIVSSSFTIPPFIFLNWKLNLSAMRQSLVDYYVWIKQGFTWGLGNKEFNGWEKEGSRERVTLEEIFEYCEKLLPSVNFLCQRYFVKLLETSRLIGCFHPKYIFNMEPTRVNLICGEIWFSHSHKPLFSFAWFGKNDLFIYY